MLRSSPFRSALGLGFALVSLLSSAAASAGETRNRVAFAPPAGMMLTSNQPANGLALRASYSVNPRYLRQVVRYQTAERPGTIVVNTGQKFLYLVLPDGWAMRYGIGVARTGFGWAGTHRISNKRKWPGWTPPAEMRKRQPELPAFMEGGPKNPLGARALYIGSTLYRIHGTNQPWTIGHNVSSGCIRLTNDDVSDLYGRASIGAKVVVL